jgi:hypothetical protein
MAITASTWTVIDGRIGLNQDITETSTTQKHHLGDEVVCRDVGSTDRGYARFKYLKGAASTVAGDAVVFDSSAHTTVRTVAASIGDVGIAMSANVASQYGWYQIEGIGIVTAGTVLDNGLVYTTATDGSLDDAQVDSQQIINAQFRGATDTGQALIQLNRPHAGTDDQLS